MTDHRAEPRQHAQDDLLGAFVFGEGGDSGSGKLEPREAVVVAQKLYPPEVKIRYPFLWNRYDERVGTVMLGCSWPDGLIEIDPRLRPKQHLETIIHELLHVLEPSWSEWRVEQASTWLASHLWGQGYRRIHDEHNFAMVPRRVSKRRPFE